MRPLDGVRVLDFGKVIAGPLCGQWLGDLGADVVKVEPVAGGDDTRAWPPRREGESAMFLAFNRNKRSLAVDLKTEAGRRAVHALAARADVVIQGFGTGAAERLGVDYATLSALKPDLIYCEISGYGRTGPLAPRPGYDVVAQAFSGMLSTMGEEGGPPARVSFSPIDQATAMHGLSGILAGLLERGRTGKGCLVEVSLLESAIGMMGYLASSYWLAGEEPRRMGSGHAMLCPYQVFEAADGPFLLGVGNDGQWRRFCDVADVPALSEARDDPRFATNAARVAHRAEAVALVAEVMRTRPGAAWLDLLSEAGVPCAPVHSLAAALAHPQVAARNIVATMDHPALGPVRSVAHPVMFDGRRNAPLRPPPVLGEHTREVLAELGMDEAEVEALARAGAVGVAQAAPGSDPPASAAPDRG